jgi:predicted transcriptional regulator
MPRFGDLEAAIMDRMWAAEAPLRVRDVVEDLRREREIAYNTVQTVMEILFRKGWLNRQKDGRLYRYWATSAREEYTVSLIEEALGTTPDRTAALARFVEQMDANEADDLRRLLAAAKNGKTVS